jgi:preprotein translocase subunit YajC
MLMVQLGLIGLVFYFLIIRPQSQARKRHEQVLDNLKRGDKIMTSGGIMGKVKDIKDDKITVETGSSSVIVHRRRIVQVGDAIGPDANVKGR